MKDTGQFSIEESRQWMRDYMYSQISDLSKDGDLFRSMKIVFAHYALHVRDIGKDFLDSRDWSDSFKREEYLKEIKEFIEKNIR